MTKPAAWWGSLAAVALILLGSSCALAPARNAGCEWPGPARSLAGSVELAEDLAIRFADARDRLAWRANREACEARLFPLVAVSHGTTSEEVARARVALDARGVDWVANVPMAGLCLLLAMVLRRRVRQRFGATERVPATVAIAAGALGVAVVVLVAGEMWAGLVEVARLGNGHLSYRAFRIPWRHHRELTFALAAAATLVVAIAPAGKSLNRQLD